jgi:hypothetical protein
MSQVKKLSFLNILTTEGRYFDATIHMIQIDEYIRVGIIFDMIDCAA